MALPVAATPVLEGEDAKTFFAKVDSDLKRPTRLVATPKLDRANELIRKAHAKRRQKQSY